MTRQKSLKARVRARMEKTGERYTAARRQVLAKTTEPGVDPTPTDTPGTPEPAAVEATDVSAVKPVRATQQATSDDAVRARTNRGWSEWFELLDGWDATSRSHTEIARWLTSEHGVDRWWAQQVTIGYEQARGLRVPGQTSDGAFSATASKTISVPVDLLFKAFIDPELRQAWLPDVGIDIRTANPDKSVRATLSDDSTRLDAYFTAKGEAKSQVALQHHRLAGSESAARRKVFWRERMTTLKQLLES